MLTHPLFPLTFLRDADTGAGSGAEVVDDAAAAAAVETEAVAEAAAPPAPAPWAKDLESYVTDPAAREAFDRYMREKQQPYITKLEQEKAEAEGKSWVFDGLQDDPDTTLREIAAQVYDDATADRIVELLKAGASVEGAEAQATAEAAAAPEQDLSELSPAVREAVEFAQAEKARREQEAAQAVKDTELKEAMASYDTWRAGVLESNPDIIEATLHAYVHAADGDMEKGLAAYRHVYPAPAAPAAKPSPTLGGSSLGGIRETRPSSSSIGDVFGEIFDAAHQGHTTL